MKEPLGRASWSLWNKKKPRMFLYDAVRDENNRRIGLTFVKTLRMEFTADYIKAFEKYWQSAKHDVPMAVSTAVVHLGHTSVSSHNVLSNAITGVHYGTYEVTDVLVDRETRRPIPFPKRVRENYIFSAQKPVKVIDIKHIPDKSALIWDKITIQPHMIDWNNHTNVNQYHYFAINALCKVLKQGDFPGYSRYRNRDDIIVQSVALSFHGESLLGDVLDIGMWPADEQNVFNCVVKKDDRLLVTLQIGLFDQHLASHL